MEDSRETSIFFKSAVILLLQDYINTYSEDGLVIKHLKTYDPELYDIYTNATVKEMLSGVRNHSLYDRSRGELRKVKTERFYLGT